VTNRWFFSQTWTQYQESRDFYPFVQIRAMSAFIIAGCIAIGAVASKTRHDHSLVSSNDPPGKILATCQVCPLL